MTELMQRVSALTLAAALATAPVVATAQETTEPEAPAEETEAPAADAEAPAEGQSPVEETEAPADAEAPAEDAEAPLDAEAPAEDAAPAVEEPAEPDAGMAEGEMAEEAEAPVEEVEGAIVMQDEDSILASELMGARVYNSADETVGDINDAIISLDGTVEGVVLGVGGFLGIGEKRVAVEMQQLSVQMDEDGDPRLIIEATRESLEAAPDFITAEEQRQEQEMQAQQPATDAGGGMAPAPADGGATAPTAPAD